MPSAPGELRRKIVEAARGEGMPVKTLPGLHELISGDLDLAGQIRPVAIEDVLGREQVEVDLEAISAYIRDRVVLVTGGGGSIGSELCRQVVQLGAKRLVLVDKAESALYEMQRELVDERRFTAVIPVLADCGDAAKMRDTFEKYQPAGRLPRGRVQARADARDEPHAGGDEQRPRDAGRSSRSRSSSASSGSSSSRPTRPPSRRTCSASRRRCASGSSSRSPAASDVATRFVAVRFGNVLGSSGSVIPIFRRQIERGGPVTVTNPEMTRFFMTIPEAASLVIQAGEMGGRGQVYVLDMGEPVKILDLARQMIELSGRTEVEIEFVGSRAGEKMHERLWNDGEDVGATKHPKIMRAARAPIDAAWLDDAARRARARSSPRTTCSA